MALQLFKIETVEVASPVTSVTFSSIPQGYTDLILKVSGRQDQPYADAYLRFNNDSSAVYSVRRLRGDGAANSSSSTSAATSASVFGLVNRSSFTANTFGNAEIYIPNYTSSNQKSFSLDTVNENNATSADAVIAAQLWASTAAINSITILADTGANFVANSTFTLYGVL